APLLPLLVFGSVLAAYYVLFFHSPFFIARYIQPLRIFWILIAAIAFPLLKEKLKAMHTLLAHSIYWGGVVLILAGFFLNIFQYVHYYTASGTSTLYLTGLWAQQHPQDKIGMQQSGIASFISPNVVNLDGK